MNVPSGEREVIDVQEDIFEKGCKAAIEAAKGDTAGSKKLESFIASHMYGQLYDKQGALLPGTTPAVIAKYGRALLRALQPMGASAPSELSELASRMAGYAQMSESEAAEVKREMGLFLADEFTKRVKAEFK